jgi:tetratricopeptide (TPR) repeat protein
MLMGDQMRRAWIDFLDAECRAHPVVVVLDDLQWGDAPTADFLDTALRLLADQPLFVLSLARPEVSEAFPDLWRERGAATLELGPLSAEACLELASQVLGPGACDVIARIFERSAGNAFFLEELVRAQAEGRGGELPDTVLAVMQSRLATLDPEARRVLRAGSLFGEVFWRGAVAPLLGLSPRAPPLLERLTELERREWISRNADPKYGGEDEYVFRHALVREAAYEMLTEEDRALGHKLAGGWLEGAGERDAMTLATHFDRGGDLDRAAGWYRTAAVQALEGNDLAGAVARVDRGIACGASGALLSELCLIRAEAHRWQASFAEGMSWAARAQGELPKGSPGWFAALREALASMVDPNDRDRVLAAADLLIELWSGSAEVIEAQVGAMAWAVIRLLVMGEKDRARTIYDKLLEVEGRFGDEPELRGSIGTAHAFWQAFAEGDMSAAGERFQAASESFLEAGDLRSVCHMRANLAHVYNELGAYRENVELLRATIADSRRLGLANFEAAAQSFLGKVLLMLARYDAAIEAETEAIAAFVKQGDRRLEGVAHAYLGLILRRMGELSRAEVEARKAVELLSLLPTLAPLSLAVLSSVLLAQGHVAEALAEARSAHAAAEQAEEGEALIRLVLVEALLAGGEVEAAREAVERAGARLIERSETIKNPAWRRAFLEDVEENARTLSLLRAWPSEAKAAAGPISSGRTR